MKRRQLLRLSACALATPALGFAASKRPRSRVRPGDPEWPSEARWAELSRAVGGRLEAVRSPWAACSHGEADPACGQLLKSLKNPYFLGDSVGLTQTLGWVDAWTSMPSARAVSARTTDDVVAAINFAREHRLRLVVKGGGHSYQGTSNAADSLLIWTRRMTAITLHDAFVGFGCEGGPQAPQPAVTVEAGAMWGPVYDAVTTRAGRYVQGGGCLTVGVAGLIQSGGFGSLSKGFGLAAASLLEAQIVTADGVVRIANACTHPDLFWALKGGGGGSLGVVTRVTLRTHALPESVGVVNLSIAAGSDGAFRRLIAELMRFCGERLVNPHWGEQITLRPDNTVGIALMFHGLSKDEAAALWRPLLDRIGNDIADCRLAAAPMIAAIPAHRLWDADFLRRVPGLVGSDDRPGAPPGNVFWAGDGGQVGQVLHAYQSAWLPARLLEGDQVVLVDALFAATRHWEFALHLNKGLAGAPPDAIAAARDTAINPLAIDAFALAICAAESPPSHPGLGGSPPDAARARRHAAAVDRAMNELRRVLPAVGSYVAEGNYFDADWQRSFWGTNYARLAAVKQQVDPDGLFFVHHGVGSERWSADGFTELG